MSKKTKIFTILIVLIIANYSLGCDAVKENCNTGNIIMERMDEAIELLNTWFNRFAVIALIVLGFVWLKGGIHPRYPISMFITIIVVNNAENIVAWFANVV